MLTFSITPTLVKFIQKEEGAGGLLQAVAQALETAVAKGWYRGHEAETLRSVAKQLDAFGRKF